MEIGDPQKGSDSCSRHHLMSARVVLLGERLLKHDLLLKEDANRAREGSLEWPSGMAREQCMSVPRVVSTSFRGSLVVSSQVSSLRRYFSFLSSGISTVLLFRSQIKPRYQNDDVNGRVLEAFHGHPSSSAMSSIRESS